MILSVVIVLASIALTECVNPLSIELAKANAIPKDRSSEMMAMMRLADISDRNFNSWWEEFNTANAAYLAKVAKDPTLLCSDSENLKTELATLLTKVTLVEEGIGSLAEQLESIRAILESTDFADDEGNSVTGLHCDDSPTELGKKLCDALEALDLKTEEDKKKVASEISTLADETKKVDDHICNCEYNDWAGNWGKCSKTCIPENGEAGIQKEQREVKWNPRNGGTACVASELEREQSCNPGCCRRDCEMNEWQEWTVCPDQCWTVAPMTKRVRTIKVQPYCGGGMCPAKEEEKPCQNPLDLAKRELQTCTAEEKSLKEKNDELAKKLCNPNPCQNQGTCLEGSCTCEPGFTGNFCQHDTMYGRVKGPRLGR